MKNGRRRGTRRSISAPARSPAPASMSNSISASVLASRTVLGSKGCSFAVRTSAIKPAAGRARLQDRRRTTVPSPRPKLYRNGEFAPLTVFDREGQAARERRAAAIRRSRSRDRRSREPENVVRPRRIGAVPIPPMRRHAGILLVFGWVRSNSIRFNSIQFNSGRVAGERGYSVRAERPRNVRFRLRD